MIRITLPSVTIHVTVKNAEDAIKVCIDSLLKLDYPNKRIYVTEAYSQDRTYEILKRYGNKIKLERVKGNASKAHNHVIKKITTDLLALTDADCIIDKNWLKELVKPFQSKDVIAAGGMVKTPRNVNKLQQLIGRDLEDRFLKFPKFVSRLPTMNLCVRTNVAKKVMMDERLDRAFETDWGYRLTRYGKMAYEPKAIVWHYHRPTWESYFKQQLSYGKFLPLLYMKNPGKSKGDHISKPYFGFQLTVFSFLVLSLLLSLVSSSAIMMVVYLLAFLFILFLFDAIRLSSSISELILFIVLYFIRTIAWFIGIIIGTFNFVFGRLK